MKKRKKYSPEQIVAKLRDADVMLNSGKDLAAVLQSLEVSEATYHRWRRQHVCPSPSLPKLGSTSRSQQPAAQAKPTRRFKTRSVQNLDGCRVRLHAIAASNGASKTTFVENYLICEVSWKSDRTNDSKLFLKFSEDRQY